MTRSPWFRHLPAALLAIAIMLTIAGLVWRPAMLAAGVASWAAGILLLGRLSRRYRAIVILLAALGAIGIGIGLAHGVTPDWRLALAANQPMISMLAAISFVRLVAPRGRTGDHRAPTGRSAVWQTTMAVHVLGSVINLTALDIIANRIFRKIPLPRAELLVLSRGYSAGAFWSPFWGASAAALTYAPAARLPILMTVGGALALAALTISCLQITRAFGPAVKDFRGYPLTLGALRLPMALVILVVLAHVLLPGVPVTGVIMVCAPALTITLLLVRTPRRATRRLVAHARRSLPAMSGELSMFLSAGLLTAGFAAMLDVVPLDPPVTRFGVPEAWALVLVMVIFSAIGVHPVISLAVAASMLAPLHPDPTLFAMTGLIAWGIQAAGGPLSGLNVVLQSRFRVDTFRIARWNASYVLAILLLAYPTLWMVARWSCGC
ncbi:hypothetical protein Acor_78290 [Acrocarpospora corrugata]|uniref:Tellurium resistance protein TerC n=1 Tax=Acrocarpospora corrugata TaxID=35763 RepID=A0A5M3WC01_9ACTN|nr:hypothetical protein [Acrocarpospora corrugata]GES05760.1 hypothetical protein Acor_78290 [Acrocarpospora corrugata]